MIYKTLHLKLRSGQHEAHLNLGVIEGAPNDKQFLLH